MKGRIMIRFSRVTATVALITAITFSVSGIAGAGQTLLREPYGSNSSPHLNLLGSEGYDDSFLPNVQINTSPMYRDSSAQIITTQVNVSDSSLNILGDAANEPTITIDPNNSDIVAIGWRQFDTTSSNFRQAGYAYSTNGGESWTFPGVIEPGVFRSDPVLASDNLGTFYFNSLTHNANDGFRCDVFKSYDGGATWDSGSYAYGGDKQWMAIDKTTGVGSGNIYAYWSPHYSSCEPGFFTRSIDGAENFDDCSIILGEQPIWGTMDVGPEGELYILGYNYNFGNFIVAKSTNAKDSYSTISWDFAKRISLGGAIGWHAGPNPGGLLGQAGIATDHSSNGTRGNVYALCSVSPDSSESPLDLMFSRSTNGGVDWSIPLRINDNTNPLAWQWFGTMSVAPTGRIDVVWLDTRDNPEELLSSLYYSASFDGGISWIENQRLSDSFDPHVGWPNQNKMGDYFHMVSDSNFAYLAWAATFNNEQDVYFSRIVAPKVVSTVEWSSKSSNDMLLPQMSVYPNPFNNQLTIDFSVPHNSNAVSLDIYDLKGHLIWSYISPSGRSVIWDGQDLHGAELESGIYLLKLSDGVNHNSQKVLLIK